MNQDSNDMAPMLQAVLDAPALQPYLHPEQPGRTPLTVVTQLAGPFELRKFGQPVVISKKAEADKPALELIDVTRTATGGTVAFRYAAEGISGTFELARDTAGRWTIQRHQLNEK
jgi:hypothetical protein